MFAIANELIEEVADRGAHSTKRVMMRYEEHKLSLLRKGMPQTMEIARNFAWRCRWRRNQELAWRQK